jgi:hypothetical protein
LILWISDNKMLRNDDEIAAQLLQYKEMTPGGPSSQSQKQLRKELKDIKITEQTQSDPKTEKKEEKKKAPLSASAMDLEPDEIAPPPRKPLSLGDFVGKTASAPAPVARKDEVDEFIQEPEIPVEGDDSDPLAWWRKNSKRFPKLSVLARKYLGTPATAAPCERLWSIAGVIVSARRANLNSDVIEAMVQLHENLRMLAALGTTWDSICAIAVPEKTAPAKPQPTSSTSTSSVTVE